MIFQDAWLQRVLGRRRHALLGDLIHALSAVVVVGAWIFIGAIVLRLAGQTIGSPGGSDFTIFYYTSRMMLEGASPYADLPSHFELEWKGSHLGNLNPPHFQLLIVPLALLPYSVAAGGWLLASYASAFAVIGLAGRLIAGPWTVRRALVWGAACIANVGFVSVAVTGEWTWFLAWPLLFAWKAAREERWGRAGVWLGVCASFKLFFLLFLPLLLLWARWRAVFNMVATAATLFAVGLAAFGVDVSRQWTRMLGQADWAWIAMNLSWRGAVVRVLTPNRDFPHQLSLGSLVEPVEWLGLGVLCALLLWRLSRARRVQDADWSFTLVLMAALLLSPLGWVYYLPLLLPPLIGLVVRGGFRQLPVGWQVVFVAGLAGFFVPLEFTRTWADRALGAASFGSLYCYAGLAVFGALQAIRPIELSPILPLEKNRGLLAATPSEVTRPGEAVTRNRWIRLDQAPLLQGTRGLWCAAVQERPPGHHQCIAIEAVD